MMPRDFPESQNKKRHGNFCRELRERRLRGLFWRIYFTEVRTQRALALKRERKSGREYPECLGTGNNLQIADSASAFTQFSSSCALHRKGTSTKNYDRGFLPSVSERAQSAIEIVQSRWILWASQDWIERFLFSDAPPEPYFSPLKNPKNELWEFKKKSLPRTISSGFGRLSSVWVFVFWRFPWDSLDFFSSNVPPFDIGGLWAGEEAQCCAWW